MSDEEFKRILDGAYRTGGALDDEVLQALERLADAEHTLGADDPTTTGRRLELAVAYYQAGRLGEAIPLSEQVFGECTRAFGVAAHDTLFAGGALATFYRRAGRLDDSIALCIQILTEAERELGRDDPVTVKLIDLLANTYSAAERIDEAIELFLEVVDLRERTLGPDDPSTLGARNNLALAYKDTGRTDEAIPLLEQALAGTERLLGADDEGAIIMRANLAAVYEAAGRTDEAIASYERTVEDHIRLLGPDHPKTHLHRATLGAAYRDLGRVDEAITLTEASLTGLKRIYGPDHSDVLKVRIWLALGYRAAGRPDDAVPLLLESLASYERLFDPDHPATIYCRRHLAVTYRATGDSELAVPLFEKVVTDWERILGVYSPDTMATRNLLALAYDEVGLKDRAAEAHEKTLRDHELTLGHDHPDTLVYRSNLALTYRELGRFDEAIALLRLTVAGRSATFGADHTETLRSRNHLALTYEKAQRIEEAIALYEETLTDCERVLGADHDLTRKVRFNLDDARLQAWTPCYDIEVRLIEAKERGDADSYLRLLAGADLFVLAPKGRSDDVAAGRHDTVQWLVREEGGRDYAKVFTRGAALPQPNSVYLMRSLRCLAEDWPDPKWGVIVNFGVPSLEWTFSYETIARVARDPAVEGPRCNVLVTKTGGPVDGPLAFGYACGALLAVNNSAPWNDVGALDDDYIENVKSLRDMWGVTTAEEWRATVDLLLDDDSGNPGAAFALALRDEASRRLGHRVTLDAWKSVIARRCELGEVARDTTRRLVDLAGTITRYEERFHRDGLLAPDAHVRTVHAYDFGRAANMARWGLQAGFCDRTAAERVVIQAGEQARRYHSSWRDFSAGYVMGRVLWFEEDDLGEAYDKSLAAHRVLTEATDGPWQTVTW